MEIGIVFYAIIYITNTKSLAFYDQRIFFNQFYWKMIGYFYRKSVFTIKNHKTRKSLKIKIGFFICDEKNDTLFLYILFVDNIKRYII